MKLNKPSKLAMLAGAAMMQFTVNASAENLESLCEIDIFASGASAQDTNFDAVIRDQLMLTTGTVPGGTGIQNGSIFFGDADTSWRVIIGQANVSGIPGNPVVCVHKRSEGGSGWGVQPVSQGNGGGEAGRTRGTPINFMTVADCDLTNVASPGARNSNSGANPLRCSQDLVNESQLIIPDVGLSDVEPAQFTTVNTPVPAVTAGIPVSAGNTALDPVLFGMSADDIAAADVNQQAMFAFGTGVNPQLYAALQVCQGIYPSFAAQAADLNAFDDLDLMPTLARAEVVGLQTGNITTWAQIPCEHPPLGTTTATPNLLSVANEFGAGPTDPAPDICQRTDGSGTQAQFRIKVLEFGCLATGGFDFVNPSPLQSILEPSGFPGTVVRVTQNPGSGDMDECLSGSEALNLTGPRGVTSTTQRWKIGFQSTGQMNSFLNNNANFGSAQNNLVTLMPAQFVNGPGTTGTPNFAAFDTSSIDGFWRFVKVDGAAPTLRNTAFGGWFNAVQSTLQRRVSREYYDVIVNGGNEAVVDTFLDALINNFGDPADLADSNRVHPNDGDPQWTGGALVVQGAGCDINSGDGFQPGFEPQATFGAFNACGVVTHLSAAGVLDNCRIPTINPANLGSLDGNGANN